MPDNSDAVTTMLAEFMTQHQLPDAFASTARDHFLPLARQLITLASAKSTPFVGINGAQGTGKSTLAKFLKQACNQLGGLTIAEFSIDDFYLTRKERAVLGSAVHPLLQTRGLPGTHDLDLLTDCLGALKQSGAGDSVAIPFFDKANDDRAPRTEWQQIAGPVDLIILEGWCVGSRSQSASELGNPVNNLESQEDPDGACRSYTNTQLAERYHPLFGQLDFLIFLAAPSFDAIVRWRSLQEEKLEASLASEGKHLMNQAEIVRFVQLFERLTRHNLTTLPGLADAVLQLNEAHQIAG